MSSFYFVDAREIDDFGTSVLQFRVFGLIYTVGNLCTNETDRIGGYNARRDTFAGRGYFTHADPVAFDTFVFRTV